MGGIRIGKPIDAVFQYTPNNVAEWSIIVVEDDVKVNEKETAYTFEAICESRTRVTQNSKVSPRGFLSVIFFLFGWLITKGGCDALQKELENLKCLCELRNA